MIVLGGTVATILLSGLVLLAREARVLDFLSLLGGVFTSDPEAAFYLGFGLFFLAGVFVFSLPLAPIWDLLPGDEENLPGALVKGALWAIGLWVLTGLLLPLLSRLSALAPTVVADPGFFALSLGVLGPVGLLIALLSYAISLTMVTAMAQGITPLDTFGWEGYRSGEEQNEAIY